MQTILNAVDEASKQKIFALNIGVHMARSDAGVHSDYAAQRRNRNEAALPLPVGCV